jgi:hypothetical protein
MLKKNIANLCQYKNQQRLKEQQQHQLKQQRRKEKKIFANIPHGRKSEKHLYDNETTETDVKKRQKIRSKRWSSHLSCSFFLLSQSFQIFTKKRNKQQTIQQEQKKKKENNNKSKSVDCRKLFFFVSLYFFSK